MALTWRSKKQIFYLLSALAVIVILTSLFVLVFRKPATCFDKKQNQNEEGVDCGGPCEIACPEAAENFVILWSRAFKTREGFYDAAALINNPNKLLGISLLSYRFKLYDSNNILVALREGQTFLNPRENFVIFESNIDTGKRIPQRTTIEFGEFQWRRVEKEMPMLETSRKDFSNLPFPRLNALIQNNSIFDVRNLELAAALFDEEGNVMGASQTQLDLIPAEKTQNVSFTWPEPFSKPPTKSEIFLRTRIVPEPLVAPD